MKKIKLPNPIILVAGAIGSFWIADIINPGFNPVGIMILLLVPVLIIELLYPQPEIEQLLEQSAPAETLAVAETVSGDLLEDEPANNNT